MATLPNVELTQQQYDRVLAAFPGDTEAERAEAYLDWHMNQLLDRVATTEVRQAVRQLGEAIRPPRPSQPGAGAGGAS